MCACVCVRVCVCVERRTGWELGMEWEWEREKGGWGEHSRAGPPRVERRQIRQCRQGPRHARRSLRPAIVGPAHPTQPIRHPPRGFVTPPQSDPCCLPPSWTFDRSPPPCSSQPPAPRPPPIPVPAPLNPSSTLPRPAHLRSNVCRAVSAVSASAIADAPSAPSPLVLPG